MHSFKPAAHRGGRYAGFLLFSALFLLVSLHSGAAFSASLAVKIRQLNPPGAIQQVTCAEHQKCLLPIEINPAQLQAETLTVALTFASGNLIARFLLPKGTLFAGDKGDTSGHYFPIWHKSLTTNGPSTYDINLFLPVAPNAASTQQPIAALEITAQPNP